MFQSSFELTGYITPINTKIKYSKYKFQSSFELTGYITFTATPFEADDKVVSKLFRAYGLYNDGLSNFKDLMYDPFQSSFELTGYITIDIGCGFDKNGKRFKALSSLRVI